MRITKRPLFYWILHRYRGLQLLLLLIIMVSLFFRVVPLEMQKRIVNEAIQLRNRELLLIYCGLYFGAVLLAGATKYAINVLQMIIGQKILVELRTELYRHILQLPLQYYRSMQPGTVISAMTAELNAIGYFLGGALAIPLTSLLTFIVFLGYMFVLNPTLALMTLALYPFEIFLIPMLQKRYNRLNKERIKTVRSMSNVVNEAISGIHEIHAHASFPLEEKRIRDHIMDLYSLLKRLFIVKYGIKFSNNLFQSFGPFFLFLVGGWFAINGQFTLGALVAFLSAHEKVYDPWKEILEYYQGLQDAQVRYRQIMELFDLEPEFPLLPEGRNIADFSGEITLKNATFTVGGHVRLLNRISTRIKPGEQVAVVGFSGSGKSTLILCMDQLYSLSEGSILYDKYDIAKLSKADINHNITLISQHPFIFTGTIRDNLLYGVRALTGNDEPPELDQQLEAIYDTGLEEDVIRFGFQAVLTREYCAPFKEKLLAIRHQIAPQLQKHFADVVEFYDMDKFLHYSSIRDNLIFGDCPTGKFDVENLPGMKPFMQLLEETTLKTPLLKLGHSLALKTVDLLTECRNDDFFFRYTPMEQEEFKEYERLVEQYGEQVPTDKHDRHLLYILAFRYIPGFHRVADMDLALEDRIVRARKLFLKNVARVKMKLHTLDRQEIFCFECEKENLASPFMPFCPNQYLYQRTLLENLLFGVMKTRKPMGTELSNLLYSLLAKDVLDDVLNVGLDFHVGSQGDRLSGGQKQKLAIARAFLRDTPIIFLDEATASLDNISQHRIQEVLESKQAEGRTIVAVIHRLENAAQYDRILLLKNGSLVEEGTFADLLAKKGLFYDLVTGSKKIE
jgi:putative ABC transport system ATP-binding protein